MLRARSIRALRTISFNTRRKMATASKVELSTDVGDWPQYYRSGITQEQSKKASEVLQQNHDKYHIFFHPDGLHNHIAHHILAIWALNASKDSIEKSFTKNATSQRPQPDINETIMKELQEPAGFLKNLNPRDNYHTFLQFFRNEIDEHGWEDVLQKYVFAGDERADAMLVRMYAGKSYQRNHFAQLPV
jgi:hypothetical protein